MLTTKYYANHLKITPKNMHSHNIRTRCVQFSFIEWQITLCRWCKHCAIFSAVWFVVIVHAAVYIYIRFFYSLWLSSYSLFFHIFVCRSICFDWIRDRKSHRHNRHEVLRVKQKNHQSTSEQKITIPTTITTERKILSCLITK